MSSDRYRAIVEAQTELIALSRGDGTLVYANPAYARQFERTPDQVIGRSLFELVPESDREAVRRALQQVLASGQAHFSENRVVDAAGRVRWVVWTNGVHVEDGETLIISVGHDITQRRRLEQEVVASDAFVRKITDSLPQRIAYVDRERRFRFVNQAHCRRFGRRREEILGRTRDELLGRPSPPDVAAGVDGALAGNPGRFEYDDLVGGSLRRYQIELIPDVEAGEVRGFFYTGLDITERARAEQALRELTQQAQQQSDVLRLVTEAIPAMVVVVGADGRYRFVNGAFERRCGLTRERIIGRMSVDVLGEAEVARRRPYVLRALAGESVTFTLDYPSAEGTTWLELSCIPLRLGGQEVDGFVGVGRDVTSERAEQDRLTALTQRDPLTGVLNRAGFERYLEQQLQDGGGPTLGLLYLDLDRFKPVNDQHGHPTGDRLLNIVGQRLLGLVRPSDAVARLGGDEFAVVLAGVGGLARCEALADKVVTALAAPYAVDGQLLQVGASVGVAHGVEPGHDCGELVRRADAALYRAKASGRGRHAS